MRRSILIATLGQDIRGLVTARVLRDWAQHPNPSSIEVFFALPEGALPLGKCVRFWRQGDEFWAEMEIRDDKLDFWPDPPPAGLHGDIIAGLKSPTSSQPMILAVIVTTMPPGMAEALLEHADQARKTGK